jgi:DHA1 family multidrug resistance protein-like MFS transporter
MFNRNTLILLFTMIVMMLGFGVIIPILPFFIELFGATGKDLGLLMAIFSVMQLIFSPFWGTFSDRVGRKPVLAIGVIGFGLANFFFALSTELWMLYASRALAGVLSAATFPAAFAYISDSTTEENRSGGMGIIGAAMGVGMVLGPGIGGLLGGDSLALPFFVAAGVSVLAAILILTLLPESLAPEDRVVKKVESPVAQFKGMWLALIGPLGFLMFMSFLISFGLTSFEGIFGLYSAYRYDYGPEMVGLLLTIVGLVAAVVQGGLTGPATKRFGENMVVKASLIGSAVAFVWMVLANDTIMVILSISFFVIANSMLRPAVAALISHRAGSAQGAAMGLNNSFMSLGRTVGPAWAGFLLDVNLTLPYLSGAVVMLIGFGLSLFYMRETPLEESEARKPALTI